MIVNWVLAMVVQLQLVLFLRWVGLGESGLAAAMRRLRSVVRVVAWCRMRSRLDVMAAWRTMNWGSATCSSRLAVLLVNGPLADRADPGANVSKSCCMDTGQRTRCPSSRMGTVARSI